MTLSSEQFSAWRQRQAARLAAVPWLRSMAAQRGGGVVRYVADEVIVADEHRAVAEQAMRGLGYAAADVLEQTVPVAGIRRYRVRNLQPAQAVGAIRSRVGRGDRVAGLNHVLTSAPFQHGGPFGPPEAVAGPSAQFTPPASASPVTVAVLDTAVWADSPLPPAFYQAAAGDYETVADVDQDGVVDGEVGHANFVMGVMRMHTDAARAHVVRVLDRNGLCTVTDLAAALAGLDVSTPIVNLSLGGYTEDGQAPPVLRMALDGVLRGRDVVVTAAAGNNGTSDQPFWPAAFAGTGETWSDQVISVTAHNGQALCPWSNTGDWVRLAAPGADVTSTFIRHPAFASGWALWNGTSFAAPRVAAAIAARMADGSGAVDATGKVMSDAVTGSSSAYPWLV